MIHEQREVVKLEFHYNEELIRLVKSLPGARWSAIYRAWYIEKRAGLLNEVLSCFKGKAYLDYKAIKHEALLSADPEPVISPVPAKGRLNKAQRERAKQYALFI